MKTLMMKCCLAKLKYRRAKMTMTLNGDEDYYIVDAIVVVVVAVMMMRLVEEVKA